MIKKTIITFLLICPFLTVQSEIIKLGNSVLNIQFDDQTALFSVTDKRCNKIWRQNASPENLRVEKTTRTANSLIVLFSGKFRFEAEIKLNENASFEIILTADNETPVEEFEFPAAFESPDKNHFVLMTDGEGLLLPADDKEYPMSSGISYYTGGGLAMAWMGVVDDKLENGYMAILETPYDAGLRTQRTDGLVTFSPVWLPSMQKFGYSRKVSYHFFDKGGYVAQAKNYRRSIGHARRRYGL